MALTPEQILEIAGTPAAIPGSYIYSVARAIEAEVRKQDDALILQLVEALEGYRRNQSLDTRRSRIYQHIDAKLDALEALTKRLALDLECVLLNRDKWWDQAHESLQAYRDLMDAWYPQEHVSPLGKD